MNSENKRLTIIKDIFENIIDSDLSQKEYASSLIILAHPQKLINNFF